MTTSCVAPYKHILIILYLAAAIGKLMDLIRHPGLRISPFFCLPDFIPSHILQFMKV